MKINLTSLAYGYMQPMIVICLIMLYHDSCANFDVKIFSNFMSLF